MYQRIAHIALVVEDYDDAIEFYTQKLDFQLLEDSKLSDEKRWVMVAPKGAKECCLLLAKAANDRQFTFVGNQTGGRVFLFLFTDNFYRDYEKLKSKEVKFVRQPQEFEYGTVAVFEDLYGNLWDLIEPNENNKGLITGQNQIQSITEQKIDNG
jgi:catechol 2,3-dioxygenase-like lactoylglutathione lyase family enzyme